MNSSAALTAPSQTRDVRGSGWLATMQGVTERLWVPGSRWWWAPAVIVYLLTRIFTTTFFGFTRKYQEANPFTGSGSPDYFSFVSIWDGFWYNRIAEQGYPVPLPVDGSGNAAQSEWAFFPAYPLAARALAALTDSSFTVTGPTLNLCLGVVLAVLFFDLARTRLSNWQSLAATAFLFTFPTSPVLQCAYTETLALVFLVASLRLLIARAYWSALLPALMLGLTRPIGLPLAAVVLVHFLHRLWRWRVDRPSVSQLAGQIVLGLTCAGASVAFPLWVGWFHGDFSTYNHIQSAWHGGELKIFTRWIDASTTLFGPGYGLVALTLLTALFGFTVVSVWRVVGQELAVWCLAYQAYLFVVLQPWTSVYRYWLLLFPLAIAAAYFTRTLAHALTWVWANVALQGLWIHWLWVFHSSGGGDVPP